MSKYILTTALGAALIVGTAVFAHDGQMHHLPSRSTTDDSFDAQMGRAMELMDRNMMVAPSGDPDRDFAAMMIPHHQGAVDMARIQLQFGKDPVLRRLAQGIIVEQLQEIDVMKRALTQLPAHPSQPSEPATFHLDHKDR
ncbi:hypothetical protein BH10PSE11_BH10PSE11_13510 [soil metagenome]